MPVVDLHIHSEFSGDGCEKLSDIAEQALSLGLKCIAITDHSDPAHPDGIFGLTKKDLSRYTGELDALKERYGKRIKILSGLEVGYSPAGQKAAADIVAAANPDYVIGSVHCVGGVDIYDQSFFGGKERRAAIEEYLGAIYDSVVVPYKITAIGHLGYIARIMPYEDKVIRPKDFRPILEKIFGEIIRRGLILEANTSTGGSGQLTLPNTELLQAYYDMGGRKVTLGSDAHRLGRIAYNFDRAEKQLKKIGFRCLSTPTDEFEI